MKVQITKKETGWDVVDFSVIVEKFDSPRENGETAAIHYDWITDLEPVGIDMSFCKMNLAKWVALAKSQCEKSGKRFGQNEIQNIMKRVSIDISCRKNGKKMAAKFAGKDAVTNKAYEAGTEIFWNSNLRAAVIA